MYILAGESRIDGANVYGETRFTKGFPWGTPFRVTFEGKPQHKHNWTTCFTHDWRLMEGEGEDATELGVQSYCELERPTKASSSKMDALEVENNEAERGSPKRCQVPSPPSLLKGRDDDIIVEMVKYIPEWVVEYTVGDVRKDASGYPKICVQAHNSITKSRGHDITGGIAVGTLPCLKAQGSSVLCPLDSTYRGTRV